ncbi:hypothetical protein [Roseibacillus ishigakijimensis]|uniref:Uncharacterized protein n=1 Tax=Roseibacillus ishigakijimensis TaxID=454146 RepID=A0A934RPN7_9BACT|nr:hypothetical protein [Roseibacillus ishigakijimensis]MBK1835732.1 hypothetical protein [Roseibacillus ishigakijimensis]
MEALKQFEKELIKTMLKRPDSQESGHTADDIAKLEPFLHDIDRATQVEYKYTGSGYFETVAHEKIPSERIIVHPLGIYGEIDGFHLGFVLFFEQGELTIDCHTLSQDDCPSDARERGISIIDNQSSKRPESGH